MPNYFHVAPPGLRIGDVITPGTWGHQTRAFRAGSSVSLQAGKNAIIMMWEVALEAARQACAPNSPSRADCVFATETLADAVSFRDRFKVGSAVYEISCRDGTPTHIGNYEAITDPPPTIPYFDLMPVRAYSYWRDQPTGITEILIGGPATVIAQRA